MTVPWTHLPWGAKALLAASLLLNLALGALLLRPPATPDVLDAQTMPIRVLQRVAADLPPADRALLREAVLLRAPALRAAQLHYEAEAGRVLELIAADFVDVAAIERAIEVARRARREAPDELIATVIDVLPEMSAEGRHALAQRGRRRVSGE